MMNKIKTILVDDEPRGLSSLKKLLEINCPEVEVVALCSSADDAIAKIKQYNPRLIFLDIAMPGKSGLEMLNQFNSPEFEIIFVTAHDSFITQAFRFSAIDYLLKPVETELLTDAVKRAFKRIQEKEPFIQKEALLHNIQQGGSPQQMKLCITSLKGFQVVELKDILYCEASSNYTNFHFTNEGSICTAKSIHEYEDLLKDSGFFRIHKSYIINLMHVKEYFRGEGGVVVLTNDAHLEVSRRKKDEFLKKIKTVFKM